MDKQALLVVDVQNDFCPGGALPVAGGDRVVPVINGLIERSVRAGLPIVATRDWHPADHCSFEPRGGTWPEHCIAHSPGAEFHPALRLPASTHVVDKATRAEAEAYSGFEGTDLARWLETRGVRRLLIVGLATDYCVERTALDALRAGFEVTVVEDAVRGVDRQAGDSRRALENLTRAGARLLRSRDAAAEL